jgi:hypothetical protein
MKLTTHLHSMPRLRMCEATPPVPYVFQEWYLIKGRENSTFKEPQKLQLTLVRELLQE